MKNRFICIVMVFVLLLSLVPLKCFTAFAETPDSSSLQQAEVQQEIYEAEDAQISGASTATSLDDYSGKGYVDNMKRNSSVTFKVDVFEAGDYGVRLRYSNGSGSSKTINVYANGKLIRTTTLPQTINWNTWDEHLDNIPLNQGENTITYKIDSTNTAEDVKLDRISMSRIYEAEKGQLLNGITVMTDHIGYSGTGFAAGFTSGGHGVQFEVNAQNEGEHSLILRYSVGHTNYSRSLSVYVNGQRTRVSLNPLRSWDTWADHQVTVYLNKGANTIIVKRDSGDNGEVNLDYITVKPCNWTYVGAIKSVQGDNTSQLTFDCGNAIVQITSIAPNMVKVWCEPSGRFDRKYDSFAVVNENINPQKLKITDKGSYYQFATGNMVVRINKNPFKITYLDNKGNILMENDSKSMGWSTDGELTVNNKLQPDEQFWGLGEKKSAFNRRGFELVMWSCDAYGADPNDSVPAEWENGRWYMANPYFVSSKGYSIYFDNTSRTVFDLGKGDPNKFSFGSYNPNPGGELIYYFTYGPSIKQITKTFTDLVGKSFFAPIWAYGNMQSHWGYKQSDIINIAQTYRQKQIPLDVIMADIDWYEYLCSPSQWNRQNFPNPDAMINTLNNLHVKLGLINDPNITNRNNNADFAYGNANGYFVRNHSGKTKLVDWPWGDASGLTDFFNPAAQQWWGSLMDHLIEDGIVTYWMDMNEPSNYHTDWLFWNKDGKAYGTLSELKNAYAIKHNETLFNKLTENGKRPFLMTRSGFTGTQRYASPWTGDIHCSYYSMYEQINMGTSLSISGYNYWGFDIGGFFGGNMTNDQFKRWIESATFTPVHRFHYILGGGAKEPWNFDSEDVARKYISLRYRLIPYMYSLTADNIIGIGIEEGYGAGGTGIPLVRPMVMEYPDDKETWNMDTQFMSGPFFLVAPVCDETYSKRIYLPEGYWYDYNNSKVIYSGKRYINYDAPVDILPVLVKEGAIIPMMPAMQYVGEKPIDVLTLDIYPHVNNGNSQFVLYEDDGETENYKEGLYTTTKYTLRTITSGGRKTLTFNIGERSGKYNDIDNRDYLMQFHAAFENLKVTNGGQEMRQYNSLEELNAAESGYFADKLNKIVYVKIYDNAKATVIELSGTPIGNYAIFEAEDATLSGNAQIKTDKSGYSADGYIGNLSSTGDGISLTIKDIPEDGEYALTVRYSNETQQTKHLTLAYNSNETRLNFTPTVSWDSLYTVVPLKQGNNQIKLSVKSGDSGGILLDFIWVDLIPLSVPEITEKRLYVNSAEVLGNAKIEYKEATPSGFGYATNISSTGDGIRFKGVHVLADGNYAIKIRYANSHQEGRLLRVYANNEQSKAVNVVLPRMTSWSNWDEVIVNLPLKAGDNTITIDFGQSSATGSVYIESISHTVTPMTMTQITLNNGGFEKGSLEGWNVTSISGGTGRGVDQQDAYAGYYKFYYYSTASRQRLNQTVTGLQNGRYMVSAWIKLSVNRPNVARIELSQFDGDAVKYLDIPFNGSYQKFVCYADVKDGKIDIAFYMDAPDWCSFQIDEVQLWRINTPEQVDYKAHLQSVIKEYESIEDEGFTSASWHNLKTMLSLGQKVLNDNEASAGKVYGVLNKLANAKDSLTKAPQILKGDLNNDGKLTVVDIVAMRGIIMSEQGPSAEQLEIGDLNSDGTLTVVDIIALRNIIMNQTE